MTADALAAVLSTVLSTMPFSKSLGIEITAADPAEVRGRLAWDPDRCTTGGMIHGGAIMGLGDTLGAVCAFLNLPPAASTTTIESKTTFFRALRDGHVEATARPLHVGRRFIVVQTDLMDARGKRVAQVTQTQAVLAAV